MFTYLDMSMFYILHKNSSLMLKKEIQYNNL